MTCSRGAGTHSGQAGRLRIACIPLSFYAMYSTGRDERRESPLIFWLVMLTICTATVPLWPVLTSLQINHFFREWKHRRQRTPKWTAVEESWKKITLLAVQLDTTLSTFLDSYEVQGAAEKGIRSLLVEIEQEYDRWSALKVELFKGRGESAAEEEKFGDPIYLEEGPGWPRLRVSISVEYDPKTKERKITHSTVRSLFPEEPEEDQADFESGSGVIVRYMRAEVTRVGEEPHAWRITLSGRFTASIKRLRGSEREKVETAISDILLSPATVLGNTKTPLSNNLRDFWRYRLGDWRLIYTVDWQTKTVTMLDYTHRSKAYL